MQENCVEYHMVCTALSMLNAVMDMVILQPLVELLVWWACCLTDLLQEVCEFKSVPESNGTVYQGRWLQKTGTSAIRIYGTVKQHLAQLPAESTLK